MTGYLDDFTATARADMRGDHRARPRPVVESEADFQSWVIGLAKVTGWRVTAFRTSLQQSGKYSTAVQGHVGWPDIILAHEKRKMFLVRELKSERGRISPDQAAWLVTLQACGINAGVWRPRDRKHIEYVLSSRAPA